MTPHHFISTKHFVVSTIVILSSFYNDEANGFTPQIAQNYIKTPMQQQVVPCSSNTIITTIRRRRGNTTPSVSRLSSTKNKHHHHFWPYSKTTTTITTTTTQMTSSPDENDNSDTSTTHPSLNIDVEHSSADVTALSSAVDDDDDDAKNNNNNNPNLAIKLSRKIKKVFKKDSSSSSSTDGDDGLTTKQKLAKMGMSALLSYGFVSNMSYCVSVSLAWYGFTKKTQLSPLAPGQWKPFLAVYAGFYVFNNIVRPVRFAAAVGITKYFDKTIELLQSKLKCNKAVAISLTVFLANVVGTTTLMCLGISLASMASGVPVFVRG